MGTKAVTVARVLGDPRVQQEYRDARSFLAITDQRATSQVAIEIPNRQRETRKQLWPIVQKTTERMRLEVLLSTGTAWEHALQKRSR